jgi:hypothetical protein
MIIRCPKCGGAVEISDDAILEMLSMRTEAVDELAIYREIVKQSNATRQFWLETKRLFMSGRPVGQREIVKSTSYSSPDTASYHIKKLVTAGVLERVPFGNIRHRYRVAVA